MRFLIRFFLNFYEGDRVVDYHKNISINLGLIFIDTGIFQNFIIYQILINKSAKLLS